jgi:hypothetical protein
MSSPSLRWVCSKCTTPNLVGAENCIACGAQAKTFGRFAAPTDPDVDGETAKDHFLGEPTSWFLFFPEGFIAALLVLATPFWAAFLAYDGHLMRAAGLFGGVTLLGYLAYRGIRGNEKWLTWSACAGMIVIAFIVGEL